MPCSKYKGKQRALCFATTEWTAPPTSGWKDWAKVKMNTEITKPKTTKPEANKFEGGKNGI